MVCCFAAVDDTIVWISLEQDVGDTACGSRSSSAHVGLFKLTSD